MPILVTLFLLILISALSHYFRDERLTLRTNSAISGGAVVLLVVLASLEFGFSPGFWQDVFLLVVYLFLLIKELIDLLLYCIKADSPIARGDEVKTCPVSASMQSWEERGMSWDEMETKGQ